MEPSRSGPLEHLQLMAQREIFEMQSNTRSHCSSEHRQKANQRVRHRDQSLSVAASKCDGANTYDVFSRHKDRRDRANESRHRFAGSNDSVRLKNGITCSWKRTATSLVCVPG
jgi:hypothetical protein